jgi:hypothetical protein
MNRKEILRIALMFTVMVVILLAVCNAPACGQSKELPLPPARPQPTDSISTLSIPKVIEQVKRWQERRQQIVKEKAQLDIEDNQLVGAIGATQILFNDSTFTVKKGSKK